MLVGEPGKESYETDFLPFDEDEIIYDTAQHVRDVIKDAPEAKWFSIGAGIHEIRKAVKRPFIVREIERLAARYSGDAPDSAEGQNHFFGNWMTGLKVYEFKNQESAAAYMQHKAEIARALAKKRRNEKRNAKLKQARKK